MSFKIKLKLLRDAALVYGNGDASKALQGFSPATRFSVGIDLRACLELGVEQVKITPGERLPVGSGIAVEPVCFDGHAEHGSVAPAVGAGVNVLLGDEVLKSTPAGSALEPAILENQTGRKTDREGILSGDAKPVNTAAIAGFVYSRSGLGAKHGLVVAQGVGVIDPDYRGEIIVWLLNTSQQEITVHRGDRIAQLLFLTCLCPVFELVDELGQTGRGAGGFGHTGR